MSSDRSGGFGTQKILTIVEGSPPGSSGVVKIPLRLDQVRSKYTYAKSGCLVVASAHH